MTPFCRENRKNLLKNRIFCSYFMAEIRLFM